MEIAPFVTRSVLTVEPSDSLRDAAIWMMERGVGSAVVVSGHVPTGILTDRDALRIIARELDPDATVVGDAIMRHLTTVSPTTDLDEAGRIMRDKGFRHLVVVDDQGGLVGVFSMRDLVLGLMEEREVAAG